MYLLPKNCVHFTNNVIYQFRYGAMYIKSDISVIIIIIIITQHVLRIAGYPEK